MSTRIGAIHVDMGLNTAQFQKGVQNARKQAAGLGSSLKASLGGITKNFAIGLVGGVGGLGGAVAALRQVASGLVEIRNEAARAGVTTQVFQEWSAVAAKARIPMDALTDAFKELNIRGDEFAQTAKGSAAEAFARLGLTPAEVKERLKDPADLLLTIIERTRALNDTAAATRIFDEIFGGTGAERMVVLLGQSKEELRATITEAHNLGNVLSDEVLQRAAEVDAKFNQITHTVGQNLRGAIVSAYTALQDFINAFNGFEAQRTARLDERLAQIGQERLEIEREMGELRERQRTGQGVGDGILGTSLGESTFPEAMQQHERRMEALAAEEAKLLQVLETRKKIDAPSSSAPGFTPAPYTPPADASAQAAAKKAAAEIDRAIANQTSTAVDAVSLYLGQHEQRNRGSINSFLKAGGVDLDAATTAWCAAFVNSALAQVGVKGSGSSVATSFLNWGVKVDKSQIQRGDVLVEPRGKSAGQTGGHVGFATGQLRTTAEGISQIEMISGNASNKVTREWVDASKVVARRATDVKQVTDGALDHLARQSPEQIFEEALQESQQRIAMYGLEAEAQRNLAKGINDYGYALEYAKEKQRLLNEAKQAGLAITPELTAKIEAQSTALATAATETERLQETTQRAAEQQRLMGEIGTTAINGTANALQDGKITAQEWLQIGVQIIQQLLTMQKLGNGMGGAGGTGGGLFGLLGGLLGFAEGGYTGDGGKHQPKGVVHGGEFVFSKAATQRAGVGNLARLHKSLKGYAEGGPVGLSVPSMPRASARPQDNVNVSVGVRVDNDGNLQAYVDRVSQQNAMRTTRAGISAYDKQLDRTIGGKFANAQNRQF